MSEAVVGDGDCICHIPIQSWWILYTTTEEGIFHELQMQFSGRVACLENEELEQVTGLQSAGFCHKGGFLMTVGMLEDAVKACRISMELYHENPTIVNLGGDSCIDPLLKQLPGMQEATVIHMDFMQLPELTVDGIYGEAAMDKQQWKNEVKENLKRILKQKPEAVYVEGNVFETYPIVHQLRKKHIPVLTMMEKDGQKLIIQIPSGS